MIIVHDLDGRITYANPAAERTFGYSTAELLALQLDRILAPDSRVAVQERAARRRAGDAARLNYELEVIHKDGHPIPMEVNSTLLAPGPEPVGVLIVARDLSQRRELERHLIEAHKIEAVGRLAGGVAHEFNNQLFVVQGYSEMMLKRFADDPVASAALEEIRNAAERAVGIVRRLLAFGQRQMLQPRTVDLNEELHGMREMLDSITGGSIRVQLLAEPQLGAIRVDPGQLQQVVYSLALNSRAAMPGGGVLLIETANLDLRDGDPPPLPGMGPASYVRLTVSDDGCGMPADVLEHVFEPFFTTRKVGAGSGLGLASVYGIVKQSNGHIGIKSEVDAGTSITICFPRVAAALPAISPALPGTDGNGAVILLAEDETPLRQLVRDVLCEQGYRVIAAANGAEALEAARRFDGQIDLLLTDVVMPVMGGRELAVRLGQSRPRLKTIFMSGYNDEGADPARAPGDAPMLEKPCSVGKLVEVVKRTLAG